MATLPVPLNGTFIASVFNRGDKTIYIYYQNTDGSLSRKTPTSSPVPQPARPLKGCSPLGGVYDVKPQPGIKLFGMGSIGPLGSNLPDIDWISQKVPVEIVPVAIIEAIFESKFTATNDGTSDYIQFQHKDYVNDIFEKKLSTSKEWSVTKNALEGTHITTFETSIKPPPSFIDKVRARLPTYTEPQMMCRYMTYTGTDKYLWFSWIDAPNEPETEQVKNLSPDQLYDENSPLACVAVLEKFVIYFLHKNGNLWRIARGAFGWGNPEPVPGASHLELLGGTNLAVVNDFAEGERKVYVSYQDRNGVIQGLSDDIKP